MANHVGFVFIAPNGQYLVRADTARVGSDRYVMRLTSNLDSATLYPFKELPNRPEQEDWEKVSNSLAPNKTSAFVKTYLTPVPAKSFQRIEIGTFDEEGNI